MRKLFLDDVRKPWNETWDVVRSYNEFVSYINEHGLPDVISFDHDLADEHYNNAMYSDDDVDYNKMYNGFKSKTGLDCAKWLCEFCVDNGKQIPKTFVHSMNPIGAKNIWHTISNFSMFYFEEDVPDNRVRYDKGEPYLLEIGN